MHWVRQHGKDRAAVFNLSEDHKVERRLLQNTYNSFHHPSDVLDGKTAPALQSDYPREGREEGECTAEWTWLFVRESGREAKVHLLYTFLAGRGNEAPAEHDKGHG